jgi:hypothetical protein
MIFAKYFAGTNAGKMPAVPGRCFAAGVSSWDRRRPAGIALAVLADAI